MCASKDFFTPPSFDTVEGHIIPLTLQWLFSAFYRAILFDSPAAAAAQAVEMLKRKYKMSLNWTKWVIGDFYLIQNPTYAKFIISILYL